MNSSPKALSIADFVAAEVTPFCNGPRERFPGVAIVLVDERLTTKEAESRLTEAGFRGGERKARKDSWSAALLLEEWIEELD